MILTLLGVVARRPLLLASVAELESIGLQTPGDAFDELASGVKVKTMRSGEGTAVVREDSVLLLEITGRLLNLNGVQFYSTTQLEPLRVQMNDLVPGLEAGLVGAKTKEIRRIIVPARQGYGDTSLKEPRPTGLGLNALNSVLKNPRRDATLLFDAKVVRIK